MATTADIRNGLCIEVNGEVFKVLEFLRFQTGRGGAFVRTKLKNSVNGKVIDHTFQSGHAITEVRIERRQFQYLYKEENGFALMDQENYEQITLNENMIDNARFLKEGDIIEVLYHALKEVPLSAEIPSTVNLKITYTEPGVKGDTATNSMKFATLETGAEIRVPLFVETDDVIKIDTTTGAYMERVKNK
jgi:elongation factor P